MQNDMKDLKVIKANDMKTWQNTDKSDWPDGEWKDEPDKAQWVHNGLDCLIVRGPSGALCGYVGVPESHLYFEQNYSNYEIVDVECHGGLTFSEFSRPHEEGEHKGICHAGDDIANKRVWWLGFDCAHSGDLTPKYVNEYMRYGYYDQYKNFAYVKKQVESLADQCAGK